MFNLPTNINKRERMVRGAIGALLLIGSLFLGHVFVVLIGILLLAEAGLSYCAVVDLIQRFKLDKDDSDNNPSSPQI